MHGYFHDGLHGFIKADGPISVKVYSRPFFNYMAVCNGWRDYFD